MLELSLALLAVLSCLLLGFNGYYSGMPAKRWGLAGLVLGPFAYPLLNAHKRIAYRKVSKIGDIKFRG